MSAKPTKTTNRLPFNELEPRRFEDFSLALIYPLNPWQDIRHYGRQGADDGVDIWASERLEDGGERTWFVQCRRYSKATLADLKKATNDALKKAKQPPDVLLVVLACGVSKKAHEGFLKYASEKGVGRPVVWTHSVLEAKLYAERPELLYAYFGISVAGEARARESTIKRNFAMKKRARKAMLAERWTDEALIRPYKKFAYSTAIIHSVDDTTYPEIDDEPIGISSWFKIEVFDFYHNGVEFVLGMDQAVLDKERRWAIIPFGERVDEDDLEVIKLWQIGRVPYRNIVEIDTIGDEYYTEPHLYCRFADGGAPYEEIVHRRWHKERWPEHMDPDRQFQWKSAE